MQNIYELLDRLFSIARPRKLLYLAIGTSLEQEKSRIFAVHSKT